MNGHFLWWQRGLINIAWFAGRAVNLTELTLQLGAVFVRGFIRGYLEARNRIKE